MALSKLGWPYRLSHGDTAWLLAIERASLRRRTERMTVEEHPFSEDQLQRQYKLHRLQFNTHSVELAAPRVTVSQFRSQLGADRDIRTRLFHFQLNGKNPLALCPDLSSLSFSFF